MLPRKVLGHDLKTLPVTAVKDETSFDFSSCRIASHPVDVGGAASCKDILAD
jgi:hypothetical protein